MELLDIYDNPSIHVHDHSSMPDEVFLFNQVSDLGRFFSSSKNIALGEGKPLYPSGSGKLFNECIRLDMSFTSSDSSLDSLFDSIPHSIRPLILPLMPICRKIESEVMTKVRLTVEVIESQVCPLFHVDAVNSRLIVTLKGAGTQWLMEKDVMRKNLGKGGKKPIARPDSNIQEVREGQIAILKGSVFKGSKGLVHRSPPIAPGTGPRLMVKFDFTR